MTTVTFTASGTWTAPGGVVSIDCQCTGSGGNGAPGGRNAHGGGGGGGGGYGEEVSLLVTPAGLYTFVVGTAGGTTATTFPGDIVTVTGNFGVGGGGSVGGAGGAASANFVAFAGGPGGNGQNGTGNKAGGGGGGAAGTSGAGGAGSGITGGSGTGGGGNGGNGSFTIGANGTAPGGAGAGGASTSSTGLAAGAGTAGQIVLIYTATESGNAVLSGVGTLTAAGSVQLPANILPARPIAPGRTWLRRFGLERHQPLAGKQLQTISGTASLAGTGTLSAMGGTPAPAVVNQWSNSYGQGTSFASITSALQSCVVPLNASGQAGPGSGVSTPGNWLFCVASWTQNPGIAQVHIGVGDDVHSWWREYPASPSTGNVRTAIYYTPNIARQVTNVYVAPDAEIAAINVIVFEANGLGPWDVVTASTSAYAGSSTSLSLSASAPPQASFFIGAVGGNNVSSGQSFAPPGWTTLTTQTQGNGVNALADNILTAAYLSSSTGSQSVSATSSSQDMAGFLLAVETAASSPVPVSHTNGNWPYFVVEAGFGSGFNTPDSEVTWTDITNRIWTIDETTGIQFQLGQIQASNMQFEFDNIDSALSSDNVGSKYYSNALNSNMSFQSGVAPWGVNQNAALAQSTAFTFASSVNGHPKYSLSVLPDGVTSSPGAISEKVAVTGNATYTASAWVYSPGGLSPGAQIGFLWWTSGGSFISFSSFPTTVIPAAMWTQVSLTTTAPSNAATGQVLVQLSGPGTATPFYVAEAGFSGGSSVLSTGLVTSGVPIRVRMALGTLGGISSNRWYIIQRYVQEWDERINEDFRKYVAVTGTDIWSALSSTPPTFYRSEVYGDGPYAWWPMDDQPGPSGVLPRKLLNAAIGNTSPLNVTLSPNGTGPTNSFGTDGSSLTFSATVAKHPGIAVYTAGASAGWMFGDPQGQPATLATGNSVTPSPGSAAWQQTGATGNTGGFGWFLTCNDPNFPPLSGGVTIEAWFNYQYFGTTQSVSSTGVHVVAQQPYCPLTIWEICTDTAPVALLQLDINGNLDLITYNGGTGTSHTLYSISDLRDTAWHMATITLTPSTWAAWVDGGATAQVSGTATGMTSAWTWMIANGDLGSSGGTSLGSVAHGGNAQLSHLTVYPYVLPYYRIMDHFWAAITAFGQLPAPSSVQLQVTQYNGGAAVNPDGILENGQYGNGNVTYTMSGLVVAQAGPYNSGPSPWAVTGGVGPASIGNGDTINVSWAGLAPVYAIYTAVQTGNETQAALSAGLSDDFASGYGASASSYGIADAGNGDGSSPPVSGSAIGDSVSQRIERLMRAGLTASPNRCIDPSALLVQAPGAAGGQQQAGDAIQEIQQSDGGLLYVDNCGHITYWQRAHLAVQYTSPTWVIGPTAPPTPGAPATTIPYYPGVSWMTDPQRIWNSIQITPFSPSGATLPLIVPTGQQIVNASQIRYGAQPLAINSWLQSTAEMQNQANWLFQFFGQPQRRVEKLHIDAAPYPAAWQLVAGMNVGDIVTVEDWQIGGGGAVVTFRVTEINRQIVFGGRGTEVTGQVEITADFEPPFYWS